MLSAVINLSQKDRQEAVKSNLDFSLFRNIPDKSTDAQLFTSLIKEMIIHNVDRWCL